MNASESNQQGIQIIRFSYDSNHISRLESPRTLINKECSDDFRDLARSRRSIVKGAGYGGTVVARGDITAPFYVDI